jgi:hypothetical protein
MEQVAAEAGVALKTVYLAVATKSGLLLVGERGWPPEQWERWFADTACAQLLRREMVDPRDDTTP